MAAALADPSFTKQIRLGRLNILRQPLGRARWSGQASGPGVSVDAYGNTFRLERYHAEGAESEIRRRQLMGEGSYISDLRSRKLDFRLCQRRPARCSAAIKRLAFRGDRSR